MKFWKRKKAPRITAVSLPVLIRQTIYDTMLTPAEGIAEVMGLPPISDEVSEMEEQASEERLHKISNLLPFIDSHAEVAAKIAAAAYALEDDNGSQIDPEEAEQMERMFRIISLASTVSCISTMVNLGLLDSKVKLYGE